jgi:hypothetical protein
MAAGVAITGTGGVLKLNRGETSHDLERGRAQLHNRGKVGRLGILCLQSTLLLFVQDRIMWLLILLVYAVE